MTAYLALSNHLGSVVKAVNTEDHSIVQAIEYDAWGNVLSDTNPLFQPFYYVGGDPVNFIDPSGLTALLYQQSTGQLIVFSKRKDRSFDPDNSIYSIAATSGRDGETDQTKKDYGPIPAGRYKANINDLDTPSLPRILGRYLIKGQDWGN